MGNGAYLVILFVGAVIVLVDGQLIMRNSPAYLQAAYRDARRSRRVARLVAVFFHLVMLGLVALVASIGLAPDAGVPSVIARIGLILVLTAAGHAITMFALSRLREQQTGTELAEAQMDAHRNQAPPPPGTDTPPEVDVSDSSSGASPSAGKTPADAPEV